MKENEPKVYTKTSQPRPLTIIMAGTVYQSCNFTNNLQGWDREGENICVADCTINLAK